MMIRKITSMLALLLAICLGCSNCKAQEYGSSDLPELALMLASRSARAVAIERLAVAGKARVPQFLSLALNPPAHVDKNELYIGLAELFGKLKAAESIPFLVRNISLREYPDVSPNIWLKTADSILERRPSMRALIQIGPESSRALIAAFHNGLNGEDRLAVIFVVSRIKDVPEAHEFLLSALWELNQERRLVEQGLRLQRPE